MWANTCWGLLAFAVTFAMARLSMVWTVGHEEWGPRLLYASIFCFVLSLTCFAWPWIKRFFPKRHKKNEEHSQPEISIIIGHDEHYVESNNCNAVNIMKTVLVGVKNTGNTYLTNCKVMFEARDTETNMLKSWLREDSFSLVRGEEKYLSLAAYNEPLSSSQVAENWIRPSFPPSGTFWSPPMIPKDGGIVTITATCTDAPPCKVICKLWVTENKFHWEKV